MPIIRLSSNISQQLLSSMYLYGVCGRQQNQNLHQWPTKTWEDKCLRENSQNAWARRVVVQLWCMVGCRANASSTFLTSAASQEWETPFLSLHPLVKRMDSSVYKRGAVKPSKFFGLAFPFFHPKKINKKKFPQKMSVGVVRRRLFASWYTQKVVRPRNFVLFWATNCYRICMWFCRPNCRSEGK